MKRELQEKEKKSMSDETEEKQSVTMSKADYRLAIQRAHDDGVRVGLMGIGSGQEQALRHRVEFLEGLVDVAAVHLKRALGPSAPHSLDDLAARAAMDIERLGRAEESAQSAASLFEKLSKAHLKLEAEKATVEAQRIAMKKLAAKIEQYENALSRLCDHSSCENPVLTKQGPLYCDDHEGSDDPKLDNTPFAHPAFWRGQDNGVGGTCAAIRKMLAGEPAGTFNPMIEAVKYLIVEQQARLKKVEAHLSAARPVLVAVSEVCKNKPSSLTALVAAYRKYEEQREK